MAGRNVSGVTLNDFFAAVLRQLGAPVTQNNLSKLGAVAALEGHGGDYNPFNYVSGPGTNFNSVGVKNYADIQTGVSQLARLLSQGNTSAMRSNLMSDAPYSGWIAAASNFYHSWGGPTVIISQPNAIAKLSQQIDGPKVTNWSGTGAAALGGAATGAGAAPGAPAVYGATSSDPLGWGSIKSFMDAHQNAFQTWLYTQPIADQQRIINEVQQQRSLGDLGTYLQGATPQVQDYIVNYLSKLPSDVQRQQTGALQVDPNPSPSGAPPTSNDPGLQGLLQKLGVDYPNAPQPTPALMAFLNGLGLNLSTAAEVRQKAIDRLGTVMNDQMTQIDQNAARVKQNITGDLVRRGVLESGEANQRYANQAQDVATAKSNAQNTYAQGVSAAQDTESQAKASARQQALGQLMQTEQDQATAAATAKAQTDAIKAAQAAQSQGFAQSLDLMQQQGQQQTALANQYAQQGISVTSG